MVVDRAPAQTLLDGGTSVSPQQLAAPHPLPASPPLFHLLSESQATHTLVLTPAWPLSQALALSLERSHMWTHPGNWLGWAAPTPEGQISCTCHGLWASQVEVSGLAPSLQSSSSLVPREDGFGGVSPAGWWALHGPVSSPGTGPLVSSRPAWWLAAGPPCLHAEEDG